jgi:hypothetical protein
MNETGAEHCKQGLRAMMKRSAPTRKLAILVLAAAFSTALQSLASAQDFVLHSQNMLRFGHGKKILTKGTQQGRRMDFQCEEFTKLMAAADIILVQEYMLNNDNPCGTPGTHQWRVRATPASGSYREYYGFLSAASPRVDSNKTVIGPKVVYVAKADQEANGTFLRAPWALLFEITPLNATQSKRVWVVNFHARFTGGIGQRQAEVKTMGTFFQYLQKATVGTTAAPTGGWSVIIGADWNLESTDGSYSWVPNWNSGNNSSPNLVPTGLTSLNAQGRLSSPYDHFVFSPAVNFTAAIVTPASLPDWRTYVSDHLGIRAQVTLP